MTNFSSNIDDMMFCRFIHEDEDKNDLNLDLDVKLTTTNESTRTSMQVGAEVERIPLGRVRRVSTPTSTSTSNVKSTAIPTSPPATTTAKSLPFFPPPPPPMFDSGTSGGMSSSSSSFSSSSPAFLVDPSTGASFHPDFMFCGVCADCQEEEEEEEEDNDINNDKSSTLIVTDGHIYNNANNDKSDSDSDSNSTDSSDNNKAFLQTTFQLRRPQDQNPSDTTSTSNTDKNTGTDTGTDSNISAHRQRQQQHRHNEILVLRSLIRAIPGVRKVSIPTAAATRHNATHNTSTGSTHTIRRSSSTLDFENIIVRHDASVHTEIILHALESAGYSASVRNSTTTTTTDNSATNINAITKDEKVSHSVNSNSSSSNNNNNSNNQTTTCWVRSAFDVQGICCASEIPVIRRIVKPLWGVAKLNINLTTKIVHVQHNYIQIRASQIARALTEQGFPTQIQKDGAATVQFANNHTNNSNSNNDNVNTNDNDKQDKCDSVADILDRIGQSPFVESTLTVEGLRPDQVVRIEKAVADSFIRIQVRAVYPSAISETVKVEHNPELVSIEEIRDFLRGYAANKNKDGSPTCFPPTTEVYIDGADANLYLPSEEDYPNQPVIHRDDGGCFSWMKSHHVNVWLSGFFWIFSIVSIVDGM